MRAHIPQRLAPRSERSKVYKILGKSKKKTEKRKEKENDKRVQQEENRSEKYVQIFEYTQMF